MDKDKDKELNLDALLRIVNHLINPDSQTTYWTAHCHARQPVYCDVCGQYLENDVHYQALFASGQSLTESTNWCDDCDEIVSSTELGVCITDALRNVIGEFIDRIKPRGS